MLCCIGGCEVEVKDLKGVFWLLLHHKWLKFTLSKDQNVQTPGAVCLLCLVLQIFLLCYSTCLIYANLTCEMSSVLCTMTNNSRHLFRNMTAMRKTLYFCWIKEQITIFAKFSWTFIQQRLQTITDITWSPTQCLWFDILDIVLSTNCREWMNKIQAVPNCLKKNRTPAINMTYDPTSPIHNIY